MFDDPQQIRTLFIQISVFGLIAALWMVGVTLLWLRHKNRTQQLERRLNFAEQGTDEERVLRLWHDGHLVETHVRGGPRRNLWERLDQLRLDAGWATPMPQVLAMLLLIIGAGGALVVVLTGRVFLAFVLAVMALIIFRAVLFHAINRRTALFEKQLVDALDLGGRSLRAGHPLSGAFQLIAQEISPPVSIIFGEIVEQEALGVSIQQGLRQAAEKSRSPDMRIFAASVIIQLRSGGNLADMMDRVAWVLRDRMRLNRRARVLTAEAQLSKWVLLALPIGLFLVLNVLNRQYMDPFYTEAAGFYMLAGAVLSLGIGAWVMNRMAKIEY